MFSRQEQAFQKQPDNSMSNQNGELDKYKLELAQTILQLSQLIIKLFRQIKRIAFQCPVNHIADPFFMLFDQYKMKVAEIEKYLDKGKKNDENDDKVDYIDKNDSELNMMLMKNLAMTSDQQDDHQLNFELNVSCLSPYLTTDTLDQGFNLPLINQFPTKLV